MHWFSPKNLTVRQFCLGGLEEALKGPSVAPQKERKKTTFAAACCPSMWEGDSESCRFVVLYWSILDYWIIDDSWIHIALQVLQLHSPMAFPNKENKSDGLAQAIGPLHCRRKCLVVLMPTSPLWAKSQSFLDPINTGIRNSYANSWINFSHLDVNFHSKLDLYLLIIQGNGIANAELPRWTWNLAPHAALWQNGSALAPANCTSSPFSASERL